MNLSWFFIFAFIHFSWASLGDRLIVYRNFYKSCIRLNCSTQEKLSAFESRQPVYLKLFGWNCTEECKFQAQWKTIRELERNGIKDVPQFFGKWTFYRLFGLQEPASFIFSVLNLATNVWGWYDYSQTIGARDPYYRLNTVQTIVTIHAWFWSILFHSRETSFTEKMDYYSAILVVLLSFYSVAFKCLEEMNVMCMNLLSHVTLCVPYASMYAYHIYYLHYVHFDYGYNMRVNIALGVSTTLAWLYWAYRHHHTHPHVWKCVVSLACVNLTLLLELFDFCPFLFVFDAHSVWHACTFPIPLLWFSFLKDEALHIVTTKCDTSSSKLKLT